MPRFIAITDNSVWLVSESETGTIYVEDRATFGSPFIREGRQFGGVVTSGSLKAGSRLYFTNLYPREDGEVDRTVMTGIINRVVQFGDTPKAEARKFVEEGGITIEYVTLNPSWSLLLPFITGGQEVQANARRAFRSADLLTILVDMVRVTQQDLLDADARGL